ncbi:prefoldin-like protein [Lachancea thermotolerans CBS 6340]|uniref:KLTH0A03190p n=1 Tax=Lachancea thermotolerans (strain ATCC 56472 / CBS 6340 / NRRL Y-8284) TaxID=559295 RepID=C5DBJ7_LACTC|nr:KLTH0A03190p [Lachancea thermotolerans CBS 6340]CAR21154.1 KLTH0A03190p [Lachancea thermotolerans CBS 6340]
MSFQKKCNKAYADTQSAMDSLVDIVSKTSVNLENKLRFLKEQKQHYSGIRRNLVDYDKDSYDDNEDGNKRGLVFGEIIISSKIYLNIGYEYFVEKSQLEAIDFITEKLRLIDEAAARFEGKIQEAKETLKNLKEAQKLEEDQASSDNQDSFPNPSENEDGLPFMEIREDLDEEGNILSSSVNPTATAQPSNPRIEEISDETETVVSGKRATGDAEPSIHNARFDKGFDKDFEHRVRDKTLKDSTEFREKDEAKAASEPSPIVKDVDIEDLNIKGPNIKKHGPAIEPGDIYTFDDIVAQLEKEDGIEGGDIKDEDIHYDFDSYNHKSLLNDSESEEDEDDYDDYDESSMPSIIPGFAQRRFLDQINHLRSQKQQPQQPQEPQEPQKLQRPSQVQHVSETVKTKSILKKDKGAKKASKKVGFAPTLDVHEIESVKRETKANTYIASPFAAQSSVEDITHADADEGFDADLFAQLIGAKDSNEVHEKYEKEIEQQPAKRKPKVSRFKKDRNPSAAVESTKFATNKEVQNPINGQAVEDIMERDPEAAERVTQVTKDFSRVRLDNSGPVTGVLERDSETDAPSSPSSGLSATNIPRNSEALANKASNPGWDSKFKKNLSSLQKPVKRRPAKEKLPELPEQEEIETTEPKGLESRPVLEKQDQPQAFPKEINAAVNNNPSEVVQNPHVDFHKLGEDLDDMARAYLLGLYNSDVEDPGAVLEKLGDLNSYNKEVETLKGEISTFLKENPLATVDEASGADDDEKGPIMTDVVEKEVELPSDYDEVDVELSSEALNHSVAVEYHRLRERMIASQGTIERSPEELQLEAIDEYGNPIRTSKFKANKLRIGTDENHG